MDLNTVIANVGGAQCRAIVALKASDNDKDFDEDNIDGNFSEDEHQHE